MTGEAPIHDPGSRPERWLDLPLNLPHAGRVADRLVVFLTRQHDAGRPCSRSVATARHLREMLLPCLLHDSNPPDELAGPLRDEAAEEARGLVESIVEEGATGDRIGQCVRNFFECLSLGREGARLSLRAGENPDSLQRP